MPRGLTGAQITQLFNRVKTPAYFVTLALSPVVYVWNGKGDTTVLGQTFKGVGEHGIIQGIESDRTLKQQEISLSLAGVPASYITAGMIAATRAVRYQGKALTVYMGFCDTDTGAPLADPTAIWTGFADVMTFQLGATITCTLTGEHFSSLLRRSNGFTMTSVSHQQRVGTTDTFFDPQTLIAGAPKALL